MHPTCTPLFCTRLVALVAFFSAYTTSIQAQRFENSSSLTAYEPEKVYRQNKIIEATPEYFRHVEKMPSFYTGFAIELVLTEEPITKEDPLFQQFGHVYYDKPQLGQYAYLILTNFTKRENAEKFIENVLKKKAPNAKVLVYEGGIQKR
jgi:hypothetical protein